MRGYNLWILLAGLWGALGLAGCQAAGHGGGESVPTFGVNQVPRQSEPPLDDEVVEQVAHHDSTASSEKADEGSEEPAEKSGNLLSRFLPSRDKPQPPRKELPLSGEKPADGADEDDF